MDQDRAGEVGTQMELENRMVNMDFLRRQQLKEEHG